MTIAVLAATLVAACGGGSSSAPSTGPVTPVIPVAPVPPKQAAWDTTGALQSARAGHTATLLQDGNVLVVGGGSNSLVIAGAELYQPATKVWSSGGTLSQRRIGHTATLLPNGKVLVVGGTTEFALSWTSSAEIYDPATKTWAIAAHMNRPRTNHTATLLPNGKVMVAGGTSFRGQEFLVDVLNTVEIYDPATNAWTDGGTLVKERTGHSAVMLANGKVLLVGGANNDVELYNPTTQSSIATSSPATQEIGANKGSATLLANGKVLYVMTETSSFAGAALFNPDTETWSPAGTLSKAHQRHSATLLSNGSVLVSGGGTSLGATDVCELYDPATNTWSITKPLVLGPKVLHSAIRLGDGSVLLVGGSSATSTFDFQVNASAAAALYTY